MNWIKQLFCAHNFAFVRNVCGDEIMLLGCKRSVWRCTKCSKLEDRDMLHDVTPPTESPIAAKCQRIEGSGEICGLTPPCPDCGSSLIDVPEGSL